MCKRATTSLRCLAHGLQGCVLQDGPRSTEPVSFPETLVGEVFLDGDSRFSKISCSSQLGCSGSMSFLQIRSFFFFFPSVVRLGNLEFYLNGDLVALMGLSIRCWASVVAQMVKDLLAMRETQV